MSLALPASFTNAGGHLAKDRPTRQAGEVTIEELAAVLADHDLRHVDRIRELAAGEGD
jgi:hypothetical protein